MRTLWARCVTSYWFLGTFPLLVSASSGASGYFAAQHADPLMLIVLCTAISLLTSRIHSASFESYFCIAVWMVTPVLLYQLKPLLGVAVAALIAGFLIAEGTMDWMDKPNQAEAERQAREQQTN